MMKTYLTIIVLMTVASSFGAEAPWPTAHLIARARIPSSLGHDKQGYTDLSEYSIWLNRGGSSRGDVRRCGLFTIGDQVVDGVAAFDVLPGTYTIFLSQPEWSLRPVVVPGITVGKAGLNPDIVPGLDYSLTCSGKLDKWRGPSGTDPWDAARVFYQTFVAKGTSITHFAYKLAAAKSSSTRVSIHEVQNDRTPEEWDQVGPERIDARTSSQSDNWVGWRSGEVPTVPAQMYAVRIEGWPRGTGSELVMVVHRDNLGNGYSAGTAYASGIAQTYDIHGVIGSDSDGTVIPYMRVVDTKPGSYGGSGVWAQTWVANGFSLAAANFLVGWADSRDAILAEAQVYERSPAGKPIGVSKRGLASRSGPKTGWLGVAWQPGEVCLEPKRTYCIEWRALSSGNGYKGGVIHNPDCAYPAGMAFRDGQPQPDTDLEMTIIEYAKLVPPVTQATSIGATGQNLLANGDFEQGEPDHGREAPTGWTCWRVSPTAIWHGPYGRNKSQAVQFVGGSINGTKIDGGLVQMITGLSPAKTYRLSGWVNSSMRTDLNYMAAVGYDSTGQMDNPQSASIIWEGIGRDGDHFEQFILDGIQPQSDSVSIWLRAANKIADRAVFSVAIDDLVLEERAGQQMRQ